MLLKSTSHRKNVVVVDDEVGMRRLLKAVLEPRGFVVVECVTGEEFLQYLASNPVEPSCVMLDLHLTGMDGLDVRARMGQPNYPVVLMTGDPKGAEKGGVAFDAILSKPIDWQKLCAVLDSLPTPHSGA